MKAESEVQLMILSAAKAPGKGALRAPAEERIAEGEACLACPGGFKRQIIIRDYSRDWPRWMQCRNRALLQIRNRPQGWAMNASRLGFEHADCTLPRVVPQIISRPSRHITSGCGGDDVCKT
jgi:hypothetical protein